MVGEINSVTGQCIGRVASGQVHRAYRNNKRQWRPCKARAHKSSGGSAAGEQTGERRQAGGEGAHFSKPCRIPMSLWWTSDVLPCMTPDGARMTSPGVGWVGGRRVKVVAWMV